MAQNVLTMVFPSGRDEHKICSATKTWWLLKCKTAGQFLDQQYRRSSGGIYNLSAVTLFLPSRKPTAEQLVAESDPSSACILLPFVILSHATRFCKQHHSRRWTNRRGHVRCSCIVQCSCFTINLKNYGFIVSDSTYWCSSRKFNGCWKG